jgi:ABC-type Fe3+-citrate transport system substrate-binding protein
MKKVAFILAGLLVTMMVVGCGESGSSSSAGTSTIDDGSPQTTTDNQAEGVQGLSKFPPVPAIPE